jgi:membrane protein CcdC involved in cytochrome C biogenesis
MNSSSFYTIVILIAALVLWRRTRAMYHPIKGNGIRLILPVLYLMPLCFLVIANPKVHLAGWAWGCAFAFGFLLSIPLILTTNYELRSDHKIYAVKNNNFILLFLLVFIVRFILRDYFKWLGPDTEGALFVTVAFGYILPWRIVSYLKFRKLSKSIKQKHLNFDQ